MKKINIYFWAILLFASVAFGAKYFEDLIITGSMTADGDIVTFGKIDVEDSSLIDGSLSVGKGTLPDAALVLDVVSTSKAFAPPRMTEAERDFITPAAGMVVYNTTSNQLDFYNGSTWIGVDESLTNFPDNLFSVYDDGDNTKVMTLDVSGIATATTRTITMPDENINLSTGLSGSYANEFLSNLGSPTAVNQSLIPSGSVDIGSSSNRWTSGYFQNEIDLGNKLQLDQSFTSPSSAASYGVVGTNVNAENLSLSTASASSTTDSDSITLETGNVVDGDSGNITLKPGLPSMTGTQGQIYLDAEKVNLAEESLMYATNKYTSVWWGGDIEGIFYDSLALQNSDLAVGEAFLQTTDAVNLNQPTAGMYIMSGTVDIASSSGNTGTLFMLSGDIFQATQTGQTGGISIASGYNEGTGQTGGVSLSSGGSGSGGASAQTGNVGVASGSSSLGTTGGVSIASGSTSGTGKTSGAVQISTGGAGGAGSISGSMLLQTGTAGSDSGHLTLKTGTSGGNRGDIIFQDGTEGTIGHVWTSTSTNGRGAWAATSVTNEYADNLFRVTDNGDATKKIAFEASGITTATTRTITMPDENINLSTATAGSFANDLLSNLASPTAINQNLIPNATGSFTLGTSTRAWIKLYTIGTDFYDAATKIGQIEGGTQALPSGASVRMLMRTQISGDDLGINTVNSSSATTSGDLYYDTGDNASTGNSGSQFFTTGDSINGNSGDFVFTTAIPSGSGVRGDYTINSNLLNVNSGVAVVKLTADPCADTVAFPESTQFYNDTSDYYCFCNGAGNDVQMHSPATACF